MYEVWSREFYDPEPIGDGMYVPEYSRLYAKVSADTKKHAKVKAVRTWRSNEELKRLDPDVSPFAQMIVEEYEDEHED